VADDAADAAKPRPGLVIDGVVTDAKPYKPRAEGRPREDGLVPQPHGGAIRQWDRDSARGASRKGVSLRQTRKDAMALLAEATPQATAVLAAGLDSEDERVRVICAEQILNRVLGRPSDSPQGDEIQDQHDISHLSPTQRARVRELVAELRGLLARPAGGGVAATTIDGVAE
jgi:hypothetical protein